MIYLHKLLPLLVSPLGLIVFLMVLGLLFRRKWPNVLAIIVLLICSLPLTGSIIWKSLESDYPYKPIDDLERHDAVVVLSGMLGGFDTSRGFVTQWGDPDRFFDGVRLVKSGKAETLIFTRGRMPWSNTPPEGELLRQKAIEMGVKPSRILLTDEVANTADEAREVKKLVDAQGIASVVIVTSSFHMPRVKLLFDHAGVISEAFPTDFKAANDELTWLSFVPNAKSFGRTSSGIREYIGRLYYGLRFG